MRLRIYVASSLGFVFAFAASAAEPIAGPSSGGDPSATKGNVAGEQDDPFRNTSTALLEEWRKKYPRESLRGRLAYEKTVRQFPAVDLKSVAAYDLKRADEAFERGERADYRGLSLAMLHGENVERFVNSPGFGRSRMEPPGPGYIDRKPKVERIPLAAATPLSEEDPSLGVEAALVKQQAFPTLVANPWRMPMAWEAEQLHANAARSFAGPATTGFVTNIDRVFGFRSHAVTEMPTAPVDIDQVPQQEKHRVAPNDTAKRWKTVRLELVSLLKQETPRVYLSENLPRMDDLSSVRTRPPSKFETGALNDLRTGRDIHTASTPNRIEMLGALRASKQCLQCHQVPHGTLLGAFSYELRRDPPIKVVPPAKVERAASETKFQHRRGEEVSTSDLDRMREKFPLVSLRDRLAYEESVDRDQVPALSSQAAWRLKVADNLDFGQGLRQYRRMESLALLHGEKVEQFVSSAGFGDGRTPPPGPDHLDYPEKNLPGEWAKAAPLSEDFDVPYPRIELANGPKASGPGSTGAAGSTSAPGSMGGPGSTGEELLAQWRLPTLEEGFYVHDAASRTFNSPYAFGYVKDLDHVAGFTSHSVGKGPTAPLDKAHPTYSLNLPRPNQSHHWKTIRLELVSLLKHETPRVYLSEKMPRMEDLSSTRTRELTKFETAALAKLTAGEDLAAEAGPNRIEMLGSLRASKQCLQCHAVPHGSLLGAFSYELVRDPPIKPADAATTEAVQ